jgi:hypothetical protein
MNKLLIEKFCRKYYLNGLVDSVKWVVNDETKTITASAVTDDKSLISTIVLSNFNELPSSELGINETGKLLKLLSVLDDDITIKYNENDGRLTSINFDDTKTDVQYVTADLSVIPKSGKLNNLPSFGLEIVLDKSFISRFIDAKNALADVSTFTLNTNKKDIVEMIIGYSTVNSSRVKLSLHLKSGFDKLSKIIHFNALYLKEILNANKECDAAILKVSDSSFGLAYVEFMHEDFKSEYFLVGLKSA